MSERRLVTRPLLRALNPVHERIFSIINHVSTKRRIDAVLRVSGGWVRDHVLGVDSHDIDFAIETPGYRGEGELLTGAIFARHVAEVIAEDHDTLGVTASSMSVIKTNPDKSKHLETAQLTVLGIPLEFCHLRTDDYTSSAGGRVPVIRPATPLEDALRRDFTVNALFYNLSTQLIEDWTSGFADIEAKLLRCPMNPYDTFLDDPLRLLRCIRFSAQLGFDIDESIRAVMRMDPTAEKGTLHPLVAAVQQKVSRERWGIEIGKMLSGRDPVTSLRNLHELQLLFTTILVESYYPVKGPKKCEEPAVMFPACAAALYIGEGEALFRRMCFYQRVAMDPTSFDGMGCTGPIGSQTRLAVMLYAALLPVLAHVASIAPPRDVRDRVQDRIDAIILHNLKLPGSIADAVGCMWRCYEHLSPVLVGIVEASTAQDGAPRGGVIFPGPLRDAAFAALRALKSMSPQIVDAALLLAVASRIDDDVEEAVNKGQRVKAALQADSGGHLWRLPTAAPVVKGDVLAKQLGIEAKLISRALDAQMTFVLHNPAATPAEVIAHVTAVRGQW